MTIRLVWSSIPALFTCAHFAYVYTQSAFIDRRTRRILIIPQPNGCFVGRNGWSGSRTHQQPFGCSRFSRPLGLPNADPSNKKALRSLDRRACKIPVAAKPYDPGSLPCSRVGIPDVRSDPVGRRVVLDVGVETNMSQFSISEREVYAIIHPLSSESFIFFKKFRRVSPNT